MAFAVFFLSDEIMLFARHNRRLTIRACLHPEFMGACPWFLLVFCLTLAFRRVDECNHGLAETRIRYCCRSRNIEMAVITGLLHVAIKTADLDKTVRFYRDVIGLTQALRPDFGYPGAWLAVPTPVGEAIIHLYGGGPALGPEGKVSLGTAAIDHVSLTAVGYHDMINRLRVAKVPFRQFEVPGTSLWQIFAYDPNGVQLELTFNAVVESGPKPDMSPGSKYEAGQSFFDPANYAHL
jgi:catechol 2,3-dioxygenase-like lactoylglutathione lyase family enzyme